MPIMQVCLVSGMGFISAAVPAGTHFTEMFSSVKSSPVGTSRRRKNKVNKSKLQLLKDTLQLRLFFLREQSPVARLVKGYLLLTTQSQRHWGQGGCAAFLSGVTGFSGRGCIVRNVAVRKSQEESLQGRNETPELGRQNTSRKCSVFYKTSLCTWLKSPVLDLYPPVTMCTNLSVKEKTNTGKTVLLCMYLKM